MSPDYATVKLVHVGAAAASIALFALRGTWMLRAPHRLRRRWVRVVPYCVDTLLLVAALWLAWHLGEGARGGWLIAKVLALAVYIALGTLALKRGRTRNVRLAAFAGAIVTFGYIAMVALTKSPWGIFANG